MKIESIKLLAIPDECPDTSHLGEYTDTQEPGVIVCSSGRWIGEHIAFLGSENERIIEPINRERNCFAFFKPEAGGEPVGSKHYRKYGMQDWLRMDGLNRGDWYYIGLQAEAVVSYETEAGHKRLETLSSGAIFGIESDCEDYIQEVSREELADLRSHLEHFGITVQDEDWQALTENLEPEYK